MKRMLPLLACTLLLGAACSRPTGQLFPAKKEPTRQLAQALEDYAARTAGLAIAPGAGENICYSPLSLFMAQGLAACGQEGTVRQGLEEQLYGDEPAESMGKQMHTLLEWLNSGGRDQLIAANSLWINEAYADELPAEFAAQARQIYNAQVTTGDLGGVKLQKQMSKWVKENTHGKLEPSFDTGDAVSVALNALYFKGKWEKPFEKKETEKQVFHAPNGDVQAKFMHQTFSSHAFLQAEDCAGTVLEMESGATMEFILPREGLSPGDLLADPAQAMQRLTWDKAQWDRGVVTIALPKFEYGNTMNLTGLLPPGAGPIVVEQGTYIKVDEQGAEAAAYTGVAPATAAPEPPKRLDLVLDRPFLYTLHAPDGTLLFVGAVQDPTK